jgi:broad specificity phosphatase PhoE
MQQIWLARHGESAGNVAAARAERNGDEVLAIDTRDPDTPLTDAGREQASALGAWLADQPQPIALWCSPYLRALDTARIARERAGVADDLRIDERLRDRELGILDLLSTRGIQARHPEEAARRLRLGKFWYRPPGGESWADVALRLRSVLGEIVAEDQPTLIVAHDVVVSIAAYVLCRMTEPEVLALARARVVGNATVTTLIPDGDSWRLDSFADTGHLHADEAPVTVHDEDPHVDVV